MRNIIKYSYFCILTFFSSLAFSNSITSEQVEGFLGMEMPSGWTLNSTEIQSLVNYGTDDSPFYKLKFSSLAYPEAPLFVHSSWIDGVEVIEPYANTENPIKFNGVASIELANSRWNPKFDFDKDAFSKGKTMSSFAVSSVLKGSPEQGQLQAKLKAKEEAIAQAKANAESAKRDAQAKAKREKQERGNRFQQLVAKYQPQVVAKNLTSSSKGNASDSRFPMRVGDTYYIVYNGKDRIYTGGWGLNPYAVDTPLYGAAIHVGVLVEGKPCIFKVKVIGYTSEKFDGSFRNGYRTGPLINRSGKAIEITPLHNNDYYEL